MMNRKKVVGIIVLLLLISIFSYWFFFIKDYEERTMVVTDWNYIQLGFNIFPNDEDAKTLFLHGGDWKLEEFLQSQEYPKVMTFFYHKETTGCGSNVGCTPWNHVYEIRDEYGTKIFERGLWQEW